MFSRNTSPKLNIFPNPTSGIVHFNMPISNQLKVVDCVGRSVVAILKDQYTLDFSTYSDGVYYLNMDGITYQIIVNH